jgi:hypothetical protein
MRNPGLNHWLCNHPEIKKKKKPSYERVVYNEALLKGTYVETPSWCPCCFSVQDIISRGMELLLILEKKLENES